VFAGKIFFNIAFIGLPLIASLPSLFPGSLLQNYLTFKGIFYRPIKMQRTASFFGSNPLFS